ncbi:ribonuclease H-like domain-containing protein [Spirochaetota bacterium]
MLSNTFIHIPGIGYKHEKDIWKKGFLSWDDVLKNNRKDLPDVHQFKKYVKDSDTSLKKGNPYFFCDLLPKQEIWRVFRDFRKRTAFFDIETTGLSAQYNEITTIVLYDGDGIKCYVNGQNLKDFKKDIQEYDVIVTYNGKCFDAPFVQQFFNMTLDHVHIDLMYVLRDLGYKGGLKGCEKQLGIGRDELDGVDGYFAVLLWQDYINNRNKKALDTLLAYNIQDVVNLERLMITSYNMKVKYTPFYKDLCIPPPEQPDLPYESDPDTINRIKRRYSHHYGE